MLRFTAILIAVCATVGLGSAGATSRTAQPAAAGPVFSGNGDQPLPAFTVSVPSTLRWTTKGPAFQIYSLDGLGGGVNASAPSGATFLNPGTHRLEVNAWTGWTIRVVKGVERPKSLGGGLVGFRGNGGRDLPPFTTRRSTKLIWTNSGALFRLASGPFSMTIRSQAKGGKRSMGAGLHEFEVNAIGSWTIGWKP